MIEKQLMEIGFSQKEASAYIALLKLGIQPASIIAKEIGAPRSTGQFILDTLVKKQIVNKVSRNKILYYSAERPENLITLIELEKNNYLCDLENKKQKIELLIPELMQIGKKDLIQTKVRYYEGIDGLSKSYIDFINEIPENEEIYNYVWPAPKEYVEIRNIIKEFSCLRSKKNITCKTISPLCEAAIELKIEDHLYKRNTLISLEQLSHNIGSEILFYKDRIFSMSYSKQSNLTANIIINKDIALMEGAIFKIAWEQAKKDDIKICRKKEVQTLFKKLKNTKEC